MKASSRHLVAQALLLVRTSPHMCHANAARRHASWGRAQQGTAAGTETRLETSRRQLGNLMLELGKLVRGVGMLVQHQAHVIALALCLQQLLSLLL